MTSQMVIDTVLVHQLDDWVHLPELREIVQSIDMPDANEEMLFEAMIDVIEVMVRRGWMVIGETPSWAEGFVAWNLPLEDSIRRIREERAAMNGKELQVSDICWLCGTEEGDAIAERLLAERPDDF